MKIGIMGGTFDPIHIGHLLLGEFAYEDFGLDEIWFLPNGNPPHKDTAISESIQNDSAENDAAQQSNTVNGAAEKHALQSERADLAEMTEEERALLHRVEMVRLAIEGTPYFKLSLHEASVSRHSYTYRTMREFNRDYPDHEFYFILGADSLFAIEQWRYFKEIFPTCTILAAMRDDKDVKDMERQIHYLSRKYDAKISLLRAPLLEISSTTIRERAARGLSSRYMVPDKVADYIRRHRLYQSVSEA